MLDNYTSITHNICIIMYIYEYRSNMLQITCIDYVHMLNGTQGNKKQNTKNVSMR